ncbi:PaaX family transcriptional regulator C-terminal domain-containing protein [Micromonospora sp. WMMD1120]|uniref:PaaX family transcriptional regulator n=1 Tax=Micromonospora sp. WMMD1120 TaxID=3016106 RepID=UPI00241649CE|nr:PaaX family transcriptional regulator C-terminal domain-containing protein [Micromonospora sp. WMMD1120]MDG4808790.1 PaaX family transcriptional regulator C-terminal domain-containing protein [Micromonospora sp. WMMD1120]
MVTDDASAERSSAVGRARAQRLLVTLLGDYWHAGHAPLPSGGLVAALAEFDIAPANARATLSRLTQRGVLERTKEGRRTSYRLTGSASQILRRGARRIFATTDENAWDGCWTFIAFTLPLDDTNQRRLLRARLRWLTFWPLYDATWVTPHDRFDEVREQLSELGINDAVVLRTTDLALLPAGRARLETAWRIDELAEGYRAFLKRYDDLARLAAAGEVSPRQALVQRTELVNDWRALVGEDPDLPPDFLRASFPRAEARSMFLRTSAALAAPAQRRFEEIVRTADGS